MDSALPTRSFMKLLSGAVLFFALIASNLQAVDQSGKNKDKNDKNKDQPDNWSISGFRDVPAERKLEEKFMAVPDPSSPKSTSAFLPRRPTSLALPKTKPPPNT